MVRRDGGPSISLRTGRSISLRANGEPKWWRRDGLRAREWQGDGVND